ncbi:hypothetical protein GCM10017673_04160 [Streptosporangium violaceochromogenes]|nr:hypothetical protein GCM10017673_04160 [Streptosporangium violaceochromogenes]
MGVALDRETLPFKDARQQLVSETLLETEFGASVEPMRHVEKDVSAPIDLSTHLFPDSIHDRVFILSAKEGDVWPLSRRHCRTGTPARG